MCFSYIISITSINSAFILAKEKVLYLCVFILLLVFRSNKYTGRLYILFYLLYCTSMKWSLYFVLLYFTLSYLADFVVFTNWKFVATSSGIVYWWHFSNSNCSLHVSVSHFVNSCNISSFFIAIILVMVICDQWSLMLPLWLYFVL